MQYGAGQELAYKKGNGLMEPHLSSVMEPIIGSCVVTSSLIEFERFREDK